jgi:hypothetical protein
MPKIQMIGRVLPLQLGISVAPSEVHWKDGSGGTGLEATFKIRIAGSIVNIEVNANRYLPTDASEIFKQSYDLARASVNLVAFATGIGPLVLLEIIIDPLGNPTWLIPADPAFASYCTSFKLPPENQDDFNAIYKIVITDVSLFRDMNDLIECMWNPHVTPVNCGRIIDSICRLITPSSKGPTSAAWTTMQSTLSISKAYLQYISINATGPRHADPTFVSGTITTEIAKRTWKIMDRYLWYRKLGNVPLNSQQFPVLQ